jgi:hypothetical protein
MEMYHHADDGASPVYGPLNYIAAIGLPEHVSRDFDLLQDALRLIHLHDQPLFDEHDRAEAMRRAQRMRLLGGTDDDVDWAMQCFVREVVEARKGEPWRRPSYSPQPKPMTRQVLAKARKKLPRALDGVTIGWADDWCEVDGLLGDMTDWILATAPRPNLPLAVAAAHSVMSAVCGRRLYTPTGAPLNSYIVALGDTGVGKDWAREAIGQLLHAAGLGHLHDTADAFTISGLEQIVVDNPVVVAEADEIATNLLARMLGEKSNTNETAMKGFFLKLFGHGISHAPFKLTKRARQGVKNFEPVLEVNAPAFSLFGCNTTDGFYETLQAGNISDGFMNRFLIAEADAKQRNPQRRDATVPDSIVDALKAIGSSCQAALEGNLLLGGIEPRKLDWTDDAKERYEDLDEQIESLVDAKIAGFPLLGRVAEYSLRLACHHAVSREGPAAVVSAWDIDLGAAWALHSAKRMIEGAATKMSSNDYERNFNRVIAFIRENGTAQKGDLLRKFRDIPARIMDEYLTRLADSDEIQVENVVGAGRAVPSSNSPSKTGDSFGYGGLNN